MSRHIWDLLFEYEVLTGNCFWWQCLHGLKCKVGSGCTVGRRVQQMNILGGLILPVWGTVEKALSKQVHCVVILFFLDDGLTETVLMYDSFAGNCMYAILSSLCLYFKINVF